LFVDGIPDGNLVNQNSTTFPSHFSTTHHVPGSSPNREFSKLLLPGGSVNEEDHDMLCDETPSFPGPEPLSVSEQEVVATTDNYVIGKEDWEETWMRLALRAPRSDHCS
jgi:hypothetical protein